MQLLTLPAELRAKKEEGDVRRTALFAEEDVVLASIGEATSDGAKVEDEEGPGSEGTSR
jgi:hypothetical protein